MLYILVLDNYNCCKYGCMSASPAQDHIAQLEFHGMQNVGYFCAYGQNGFACVMSWTQQVAQLADNVTEAD